MLLQKALGNRILFPESVLAVVVFFCKCSMSPVPTRSPERKDTMWRKGYRLRQQCRDQASLKQPIVRLKVRLASQYPTVPPRALSCSRNKITVHQLDSKQDSPWNRVHITEYYGLLYYIHLFVFGILTCLRGRAKQIYTSRQS